MLTLLRSTTELLSPVVSGKPEIYLYASHYVSGFLNDKPVARLREDLAALRLGAPDDSMSETEDHFACLCDDALSDCG
jgi:TorA maturation chaperone TorD